MSNKRNVLFFLFVCALLLISCGERKEEMRSLAGKTKKGVEEVLSSAAAESEEKMQSKEDSGLQSEADTGETKEQEIPPWHGGKEFPEEEWNDFKGSGDVDVDLTKLSSTMVFAEVYQIMVMPQDYMGKSIRMNGMTAIYDDVTDGSRYYSCIVMDATACCSQGIEFKLKEGQAYPKSEEFITVKGIFDVYEDGTYKYAVLKDAVLE